MREVFDCDHVIVRPGVEVLVMMNRIAFRLRGDMNWYAHGTVTETPARASGRRRGPPPSPKDEPAGVVDRTPRIQVEVVHREVGDVEAVRFVEPQHEIGSGRSIAGSSPRESTPTRTYNRRPATTEAGERRED